MAAEPVAEKEGVLFVATDSKAKKPKPFLLRLYGSSLYAYRLRPEGKVRIADLISVMSLLEWRSRVVVVLLLCLFPLEGFQFVLWLSRYFILQYGTAVKWCLQLNDALFDERRGTDAFAITYFNKNYVFMTAPDTSLSK